MKSKYDLASLPLTRTPLGRWYRLLEKNKQRVREEKERRQFHLDLGFFFPNFCLITIIVYRDD